MEPFPSLLKKIFLISLILFNTSVALADDDDDDDDILASTNIIAREHINPRLRPLGFGLMGDTIDTDKGTVVFSVTDVSIPGNSQLEVAIRRKTGSVSYTNEQDHYMADWIIDVPSISTFMRSAHIWSNNRCSRSYTGLPTDHSTVSIPGVDDTRGTAYPGFYKAAAWWEGLKLNLPGQGSQLLLENTKDEDGNPFFAESRWSPYVWQDLGNDTGKGAKDISRVTPDHHVVSCLDSASVDSSPWDFYDDPGEGFIVTSPDGTRYTMSRLHYFSASPYIPLTYFARSRNLQLLRNMATILVTKVEDVSGNWVNYEYTDDGKLKRIHSNDNREITLAYSADGFVETVTANDRTWTYTYEDERFYGETRKLLHKVVQPDGNFWEYNIGRLTRNRPSSSYTPEESTISIKHPYGVEAEYTVIDTYRQKVQGSWATPALVHIDSAAAYMGIKSVSQKTLSGPSIPTSTWTYEAYAVDYQRYLREVNPAGRVTEYSYGLVSIDTKYGRSMYGRKNVLKEVLKYEYLNGPLLEKTVNTYISGGQMGYVRKFDENTEDLEIGPVYMESTVVTRGDDTFTTEYTYNLDPSSSTYSYGKPTSIKTHSNVSTLPRETSINYIHKKDPWVLGLPTTVTINDREKSTIGYDSYGRKISETRFGSEPVYYAYHTHEEFPGMLYAFRDANGKTTYANFYKSGIPGVIERPDGSFDQENVDDNGWTTARMDFNGYWTTYKHDEMGRLTKIIPSKTEKDWLDTDISYEFGDNVTQTITRGDKEEVITYDNYLRTIHEGMHDLRFGDAIYTRTEYNAMGEAIFTSFPSSTYEAINGVERTYDGLGRLKTSQENVTPYATTTYGYFDGHRRSITDAANETTYYDHDGYSGPDSGKLLRISQPLGVETQLNRNEWGQLTRLRQYGTQNGITMDKTQTYTYDAQQRLCRHHTFEGGASLYTYDAAGNMTAYQRGASSSSCSEPTGAGRVDLELDDLYRVKVTNFADAATPDIHTDYDDNGNTLSVKRDGADWTYTYDELNHLTTETLDIDDRRFTMSYVYTAQEQLWYHTLPSGRIVGYGYDGLNRHTSAVSVNGPDKATTLVQNITYHPNGLINRMVYPNSLPVTGISLTFNQGLNARQLPGQVSLSASDEEESRSFRWHSYDVRGNLTEIYDEYNGQGTRILEYDALNRLTDAKGPWGEGTFTYDALGNLRKKTLGSRTVNVNYSSYYNRPTSNTDTAGSTRTISHDTRGNVTRLGGLTFAYDYSDQPVQISGSSNGSYKYDGNLKRVKSVVDGKIIYNIYNAAGKLVHVDAVTDGKQTEYIHGAGQTLAHIVNDTDVTYLHNDHLGTPFMGTDASGNELWEEEYTPYGEKYKSHAANDDLGGYTGHIYDSATGLNYMQARYHDPVMGRFLSIDPVGFKRSNPMSFNRYAYANNNPYTYVDPDGEFPTNGINGVGIQYGSEYEVNQAYANQAKDQAQSAVSGLNAVSTVTGHGSTALLDVAASSILAGPAGVAAYGGKAATASTVLGLISLGAGELSDAISGAILSDTSTQHSGASTAAPMAAGALTSTVLSAVGARNPVVQAGGIIAEVVSNVLMNSESSSFSGTESDEKEIIEDSKSDDSGV